MQAQRVEEMKSRIWLSRDVPLWGLVKSNVEKKSRTIAAGVPRSADAFARDVDRIDSSFVHETARPFVAEGFPVFVFRWRPRFRLRRALQWTIFL